MQTKTYWEIFKAIAFLTIIGALIMTGYAGFRYIDIQFDKQEKYEELLLKKDREYKEYAENLVRSHTEVVNSLKEEIEKLKNSGSLATQEMLAEIKKKDEEIINMGTTIASLKENVRELRVKSDHMYKEGTGDYNEQYFKKIMYKVKDEDGNEIEVPIAWVIYYPNRELDKQWKTGVYSLDYKAEIVQSEQKDGQLNTYVKVTFENTKDKASRGIEVPVKIKSSEFKQLKQGDPEFHWWAPSLNLNLDFGLTDFDIREEGSPIFGGISLSTSGYGRTENDLTWRFIDFGISTNFETTYFKFTPFAYNIGKSLPLIDNTFIGPFGGISTDGEAIFGIGISIKF